jgi:hypothetical protein
VSSASASALLLAAPPPHAAHSAAASSAATAAQQAALPGAGDGTEVDDDRPVSASGRPTLGLAAYRVRKHIGRGKFGGEFLACMHNHAETSSISTPPLAACVFVIARNSICRPPLSFSLSTANAQTMLADSLTRS